MPANDLTAFFHNHMQSLVAQDPRFQTPQGQAVIQAKARDMALQHKTLMHFSPDEVQSEYGTPQYQPPAPPPSLSDYHTARIMKKYPGVSSSAARDIANELISPPRSNIIKGLTPEELKGESETDIPRQNVGPVPDKAYPYGTAPAWPDGNHPQLQNPLLYGGGAQSMTQPGALDEWDRTNPNPYRDQTYKSGPGQYSQFPPEESDGPENWGVVKALRDYMSKDKPDA